MSIIPPAVLTTTQIVAGLAASAKNAFDLSKVSSDHALKGAISELYDSMLDVKARVLELDEENRKLRAQLEQKGDVVGPFDPFGYFYEKSDEAKERPLCPRCWQSQTARVVFMSPPTDGTAGWRSCVVCSFNKFEPHPDSVPEPKSRNYWE